MPPIEVHRSGDSPEDQPSPQKSQPSSSSPVFGEPENGWQVDTPTQKSSTPPVPPVKEATGFLGAGISKPLDITPKDPAYLQILEANKSAETEPSYGDGSGKIQMDFLSESFSLAKEDVKKTLLTGLVMLIASLVVGFVAALITPVILRMAVTPGNPPGVGAFLAMLFPNMLFLPLSTLFLYWSLEMTRKKPHPFLPKGSTWINATLALLLSMMTAYGLPLVVNIVAVAIASKQGGTNPILFLLGLLLTLPAIYVLLRLIFSPLICFSRPETGPVAGLKQSWKITQGNVLKILLLVVLSNIAVSVGAIFCGIGLLYTLPLALFFHSVAYRHLEPALED